MAAEEKPLPPPEPGDEADLAPSMPQYFLGYAIVFGAVVALALALALLMKLMR